MFDGDYCERLRINDTGKRKHYKYLDSLATCGEKLHSLPPISPVGHNAEDLSGYI